MKFLRFLLLSVFLLQANVQADQNLHYIPTSSSTAQQAFQVGEYLKYRVHYGILDAGFAELRVSRIAKKNGKPSYHVVGTGWSTGMFNWFFEVEDRYESYIDTSSLVPHFFIRNVNEDGHKIYREISFDQEQNVASTEGKDFNVPERVHDLLSSFYFARTMDVSKMKIGEEISVDLFLDYEVYTMKMIFKGTEIIKSDVGRFNCLKFSPQVQAGNVFRGEDALSLWVTNDEMHIPIRAQADILVGSIKMDLMEYRNTKSPLNPL